MTHQSHQVLLYLTLSICRSASEPRSSSPEDQSKHQTSFLSLSLPLSCDLLCAADKSTTLKPPPSSSSPPSQNNVAGLHCSKCHRALLIHKHSLTDFIPGAQTLLLLSSSPPLPSAHKLTATYRFPDCADLDVGRSVKR